MDLYLTTNCPWNTTFCNIDGQVIYKTESPIRFCLGPRSMTIKRILPSHVDLKTDGDTDSEDALRDSFSKLAEIDYNFFASSRIRYNGMDVATTEFLRKAGCRFFVSNRVFKGPDGNEYEWHLGTRVCKLYTKNPSKTLVAAFHRRRLGIIGDARPASLEICPQGQHMVDLIVVTFIFVEKLRSDKERLRRSARGGGGGP